jgi:hypothetical protein
MALHHQRIDVTVHALNHTNILLHGGKNLRKRQCLWEVRERKESTSAPGLGSLKSGEM